MRNTSYGDLRRRLRRARRRFLQARLVDLGGTPLALAALPIAVPAPDKIRGRLIAGRASSLPSPRRRSTPPSRPRNGDGGSRGCASATFGSRQSSRPARCSAIISPISAIVIGVHARLRRCSSAIASSRSVRRRPPRRRAIRHRRCLVLVGVFYVADLRRDRRRDPHLFRPARLEDRRELAAPSMGSRLAEDVAARGGTGGERDRRGLRRQSRRRRLLRRRVR